MFLKLARKADVLVENFAAGVMDRLGLGYEVLASENPRLVYGSGTGFGLTGPYRDLPAMDLTIQAMSGIMNATGYPDRPPVKAGARRLRFPGWRAPLRRHPGRAGSARAHRPGPARRGRHARRRRDRARQRARRLHGRRDDVPPRTANRHPALAMAPYNVYERATATSRSSPPPTATGSHAQCSAARTCREPGLRDDARPCRAGRGDRRHGHGVDGERTKTRCWPS